jgi:hypothetical protein
MRSSSTPADSTTDSTTDSATGHGGSLDSGPDNGCANDPRDNSNARAGAKHDHLTGGSEWV